MPRDDCRLEILVESVLRFPSGIFSISPAPNVGVGMRKMMFLCWIAWAKFGCVILQPVASVRPVITKRSCTPPSAVPFGFLMKRASRMGPFAVMKDGTVLVAPALAAIAGSGLVAGLVPPIAGCEWHAVQLSALKRGPRPWP